MSQIQVQMIDNTVSSDWWRKLVQHFVKVGDELEVRCWKEETAEIQQASLYGKPVNEMYEVSIKGIVTTKLLTELLTDEPADRSIYNKMTKYFTINAISGQRNFSSTHYGTEMYIDGVLDDDIAFFSKIMEQYNDCFSISMGTNLNIT